MSHDLVIRNGLIVDGTGLAGYRADLGIDGAVISEIGRIRDRGKQEIDAEGHAVTPGFIDPHTHMDAQVFWDHSGANACWHGVTTVIMGHCGFSLAPSSSAESSLVIRSLERAEDISGSAIAAGIDWSWRTFPEYLDVIDRLPKGVNYAANVGHSALRIFAMRERAFTDQATEEDMAAMVSELRSAMRHGAVGFSTSRTVSHLTPGGDPVPSRLATWPEVGALVDVMDRLGTGVFQMTQDQPTPDQAEEFERRMLELARTGRPIVLPAAGSSMKVTLALLERMAAVGGNGVGLTHCRGIGSLMSFRTRTPFDLLAAWRPIRALPPEEQRNALGDPNVRARLVYSAQHDVYPEGVGAEARKPDYDKMRILDSPLPPNPTVAEAAAVRGRDPVEVMIDMAVSNFDTLYFQHFTPFDHDAVKAAMAHPLTVTGFSDAGAHVGQISDASLPTYLLAHWVRNRQDFSFEEAIRMLSLEPARVWGFHDRGLIREGMIADLNVLDPETVAPRLPTVVSDLPAGQRRFEQTADGFMATVVAGRITQSAGQPTGELSGQLLRGPLSRRPIAAVA